MKMSLPKFQPSCTAMNFIEEWHPEAYKLLSSFKPDAQKSHLRKILLKAMQIKAGLTLGLLATYVTAETILRIEILKSRMYQS
jgi:hypothetical protein